MLTIDQGIALVAGVATLSTALATFLTVREISRQRRASYRPDLISAHQYAYALGPLEGNALSYSWVKTFDDRGSSSVTVPQAGGQYSITLFNVGSGAAKDIETEWKLDLASWVARINALAQRSATSLVLNMDLATNILQIAGSGYPHTTHLVGNQLKHRWGHLLPASLDKNGIELLVPSAFLTLVALQVALGSRIPEGSETDDEWRIVPHADLLLRYIDVGGTRHTKGMKLSLGLLAAGHQGVSFQRGQTPSYLHFITRLEA